MVWLYRVMAVPATVVYFSCYEHFRNLFGYSAGLEENDWWKPIMAGASARSKYFDYFLKTLLTFYVCMKQKWKTVNFNNENM